MERKGLNAPHKQDIHRNLVRDHNPNIIFVQETKMGKEKVEKIRIFKNNGVVGFSSEVASRWVSIFCNQNHVQGSVIMENMNYLSVNFVHIKMDFEWVTTTLYAPNSKASRSQFWKKV